MLLRVLCILLCLSLLSVHSQNDIKNNDGMIEDRGAFTGCFIREKDLEPGMVLKLLHSADQKTLFTRNATRGNIKECPLNDEFNPNTTIVIESVETYMRLSEELGITNIDKRYIMIKNIYDMYKFLNSCSIHHYQNTKSDNPDTTQLKSWTCTLFNMVQSWSNNQTDAYDVISRDGVNLDSSPIHYALKPLKTKGINRIKYDPSQEDKHRYYQFTKWFRTRLHHMTGVRENDPANPHLRRPHAFHDWGKGIVKALTYPEFYKRIGDTVNRVFRETVMDNDNFVPLRSMYLITRDHIWYNDEHDMHGHIEDLRSWFIHHKEQDTLSHVKNHYYQLFNNPVQTNGNFSKGFISRFNERMMYMNRRMLNNMAPFSEEDDRFNEVTDFDDTPLFFFWPIDLLNPQYWTDPWWTGWTCSDRRVIRLYGLRDLFDFFVWFVQHLVVGFTNVFGIANPFTPDPCTPGFPKLPPSTCKYPTIAEIPGFFPPATTIGLDFCDAYRSIDQRIIGAVQLAISSVFGSFVTGNPVLEFFFGWAIVPITPQLVYCMFIILPVLPILFLPLALLIIIIFFIFQQGRKEIVRARITSLEARVEELENPEDE
jgi:hypothetical protein